MNSVGSTPPRHDAADKVTGAARYPDDRYPPESLHAIAVFSNEPHARLLAIDTTQARTAPGVVTVLTAKDVPVNEYGMSMFDQPVLIGVDSTGRSEVPCEISRWEADHLAVIVAETPAQAGFAAGLIKTTWEQLPLAPDLDAARRDEVLVHPETGTGTNIYCDRRLRKGDIEAGWEEAEVIIEGSYRTPYQEHAYLQPEAGTGWIDAQGRLTIEIAGQGTHEDRHQIARALDVSDETVRVIYPAIGGAFGGREDASLQIVLALATKRVHELGIDRPVHMRWSREESIVGHCKRHRCEISARLGARLDGTITAMEAEVWLDAGAYNYSSSDVLAIIHLGVAGPYLVPAASITSRAVYTHATPGGAFRGFGGPQAGFVAEAQMNKLAARLGMDPVEIRRRNALREGSIEVSQTAVPRGITLLEVIDECERTSGFQQPIDPMSGFSPLFSLAPAVDELKRGRGFAAGRKNVAFGFGFPEACGAEIHLVGEQDEPTEVELYHAAADLGQGAHLALRQIAADAAGVPLESVRGHFSDTSDTTDSGAAAASRLTFMAGNSILGAVEQADKLWRDGERPAIGRFRYIPPPTEDLDPNTGAGAPVFCYGYMATAVEVTVDTGTGHVRVDHVTSVHDVGRAINPRLVRGQIEGAVAQAHGYTITEDLRAFEGRIVNPRLSTYLIPGIGDGPTMVDCVILELSDPLGPYGARGVAEMPFVTYGPAVIAAVYDATGVWFDEFPLTPARVVAGLRGSSVGADR